MKKDIHLSMMGGANSPVRCHCRRRVRKRDDMVKSDSQASNGGKKVENVMV